MRPFSTLSEMTSVALFLLQRQSTGISQIVGNLSAGVVLITVLIADKLHECGRFDADLDRPSALVLLPDNAVPFERFVFLRHRSNSSLSIASQRRKAIFPSLNFD